jgi:hypothetical protein
MPLYDFSCDAGHRFEKVVSIAVRNHTIGCQIPGCPFSARRVEISHAHPAAMLDYGLAANRDAAREGRYDPHRPITRGVRR